MATEADFQRIGNYPVMYNGDQNIDRRHAQRVVPLEVICPGYSRTGTLTMQKALDIFGYPNPFHFSSVLANVSDSDLWMEALNAKFYGQDELPDKAFFDGALGHVGAVSDAPCNLFAEELMKFYPEAKIVFVERDLECWYRSWMKFCENAMDPRKADAGKLDPEWFGKLTRLGGAITRIQSDFSTTYDEARVRSKKAYVHHYRDIREMADPKKLLIFGLEDGWEPLCNFLGKKVPDVPFPHENDSERNAQVFRELVQMAKKKVAAKAS